MTGRKYRNQIKDHRRLREVSDAVCQAYDKSVLQNAPFYGGEKATYWVHRKGGKTHRDILREDFSHCLREAYSIQDLTKRLNAIGYVCDFDPQHKHWTVRAVDWERVVRIDKLGFTKERIMKELDGRKLWSYSSINRVGFYLIDHPIYKPPIYPVNKELKRLEYRLPHAHSTADVAALMIVNLFLILLLLIKLATERADYTPQTPGLRKLIFEAPKIEQEYRLLIDNKISSMQELFDFHDKLEAQIHGMEAERQKIRNRIRRCSDAHEKAALKQQAKDISKQLKPLRQQNKIAERIEHRAPKLLKMMILERDLEIQAYNKQRNQRNYERN